MKQKQLKAIPLLRGAAALAKAAATDHGAAIPLLQNTAANIGTDADALTTACNIHEEGKVVLANYRSAFAAMMVIVRTYLTLGRDILKPVLGTAYSPAYTAIGLIGSLIIPSSIEEMLVVLQAYKAYFTAHPELEDPLHNITAAQAQALYDQLLVARKNVNDQVAVVQGLRIDRDAVADTLRKRMRGLIGELGQRLDAHDPRWLAFGFNKPGAQQTPGQVTNVHATLVAPGTAAMRWDATARAQYYRVWKKVVGVDAEPIAVDSRTELDITIDGLPAGATIEFYVSAVNDGGEGLLSEKVTVTTHA